jgi:hypothetical protein
MGLDNLFFEDEPKKEKKSIQERSEEIIKEAEEKYNRRYKRKINPSVYSKVDKEDLEELADLISMKKLSYKQAFKKLCEMEKYIDFEDLQTKKHQSLRSYLILHKFVYNPKVLANMQKSISNSGYAKNKRDRIISDVINQIIEEDFNLLLENKKFQSKMIESLFDNLNFKSKLEKFMKKHIKT